MLGCARDFVGQWASDRPGWAVPTLSVLRCRLVLLGSLPARTDCCEPGRSTIVASPSFPSRPFRMLMGHRVGPQAVGRCRSGARLQALLQPAAITASISHSTHGVAAFPAYSCFASGVLRAASREHLPGSAVRWRPKLRYPRSQIPQQCTCSAGIVGASDMFDRVAKGTPAGVAAVAPRPSRSRCSSAASGTFSKQPAAVSDGIADGTQSPAYCTTAAGRHLLTADC
jgi:hypothetical protein